MMINEMNFLKSCELNKTILPQGTSNNKLLFSFPATLHSGCCCGFNAEAKSEQP